MFESFDNFFRWLKSAELIKDLVIRLVVLVIVLGIAGLLWFISVPIFAWYLYSRFGNKRIKGCKCVSCNTTNACEDKFCINCGTPLHQNHSRHSNTNHKTQNNDACKCPKCNSVNSCDDKFCTQCGTPLNNDVTNSSLYKEISQSIDGVIVALLAKIAKIDGRISEEEADYMSSVFDMLSEKRGDRTQIRKIYKTILENEKDNLRNVDELCRKFASVDIIDDFKIDIVRIFVELAYINGTYDSEEENIIVKIVHNLHLNHSIYQNIKAEFEPHKNSNGFNGSNLSLDECYKILESQKSDTMETIKKNYRRLVKQYHYDSIVSKQLPQDMIDFAEEKLKQINATYEKVKQHKGYE